MAQKTKTKNHPKEMISSLDDKERAFLSIILMNKGTITTIKLKRVFLERYTLWSFQRTEKKLAQKGLLLKNTDKENKNILYYKVPKEFADELSKSFSSLQISPINGEQFNRIPKGCCHEYSIIRYLWQIDSFTDLSLLRLKRGKGFAKIPRKKAEELLGIEKERVRFLILLYSGLPTLKLFTKRGYEKWSDVLLSPQKTLLDIFKLTYEMLRESNELGRDDIGKDNMDFFFEELAAFEPRYWYSLSNFVSNAKSTLFSCNQPYRFINFEAETVWEILLSKLNLIGIVDTMEMEDEKFIRLTTPGAFCLGSISEDELQNEMNLRKGKLMVHPNFEVTLVSNELDPRIPLELAMFSKPTILDTMSVFKITKESVLEGVRLGLTSAEMVSFLEENCKGEVPQNVDYSIMDWGS